METAAVLSVVRDRIARSGDAATASRAGIARSRQRISDSLHLLGLDPKGFAPPPVGSNDEQRAMQSARDRARAEQREIDAEVRRSGLAMMLR